MGLRRAIALFAGVAACSAPPDPIELPALPADRALIVIQREVGGPTRYAAIDPIRGAGAECLEQLARPAFHDQQVTVELWVLGLSQSLDDICLPAGCFEPVQGDSRPLPAPHSVQHRRFGPDDLGAWSAATLPEELASVRLARRCIQPPAPAVRLRAGDYHTCAVLEDASLWCWGNNERGQLGDGGTSHALHPRKVDLAPVRDVALGPFYSCAVLRDQSVWCWGDNEYGQLGDGTTEPRDTPQPVAVTDGRDIAAGRGHTCATLNSGGAVCWGLNDAGELGDGTRVNRLTPTPVAGIENARGVWSGDYHSCVTRDDRTVACWGYNYAGEASGSTTTAGADQLLPVPIAGLDDISELALGSRFSCARVSQSGTSCWGYNRNGTLGIGTDENAAVPTPVPALTFSSMIAAQGLNACAVLNFKPLCWGRNFGSTPLEVGGFPLSQAVAIGGGRRPSGTGTGDILAEPHVCTLSQDGAVWCRGGNDYGQLGDGTTAVNRPQPKPVLW